MQVAPVHRDAGAAGLDYASPQPRPKPRTFRLSSIPVGVPRDQLLVALEALSALSGIEDGTRPSSVKVLSLARKSRNWQVGTVSFVREPAPFTRCLPNDKIELPITIAGNEFDMTVDVDFYGMTPLYCHPSQDAVFDIIAVCGVGGHAFGSWRSPLSGHKMWLRDFLPKDIPEIRTFIFGYDSGLRESTSTSSLVDYARQLLCAIHNIRAHAEGENRRPIILVGHSVGGLLIKEAMAVSAQGDSEEDLAILQSCVGFLLFGVPNRGLDASNLAALVRGQKNARLIADLNQGSPLLLHIDHAFQRSLAYKGCLVVSFYETKDSNTVNVLPTGEWSRTGGVLRLVSRDSATSFCPSEAVHHQIPIDTDHSSLVKFSGHDDQNYETVWREIEGLVKKAPDIIKQRRKYFYDCPQPAATAQTQPARHSLSADEQKCHQKFLTMDYATARNAIPKRHDGTLEWVLRDNHCIDWVEDRTNFLWISGNPGAGKTVLTSYLLDCLDDMAKEQVAGTVAVVYFICDDKDDSRKSAEAILCGLIHQIITTAPVLIEHAIKYHNTDGSRFIQSFGILWKMFLAMITDHRICTTYVVLDALDECEEKSRNQLLDMLCNYFHSSCGNTQGDLKVLMTSRPYHQIQNKLLPLFRSESANCIRLKTEDQGDKIEADISSFIMHKVDELAQICSYDNATRLMVFRKLKDGADGMFLWVSLIMTELLETPADKVEETLNESPADLDSLYQFLLQRLAPKAKYMANLILKWVVFAPRPMKLDELAIACALKPGYRSASCIESSLIHGFSHNVSICGPILKVQDGTVHLVHQSAKEFLLRKDLHDFNPGFFISPQQANLELAEACMTYLSFNDFDCKTLIPHSSEMTDEMKECPIFHEYPFLWFAGQFWPQFVQNSDQWNEELCRKFVELNVPRNLVLHINLVIDRFDRYTIDANEFIPTDALQILAYLGIYSFVDHLLSQGYDVNAQGGFYGSALQAAAARGHEDMTHLLIENGADVNIWWGSEPCSALQAAVHNGYGNIVSILLEKGANVNEQGEGWYHGSAIETAATRGDEHTVRLLIENGADVDIGGGSEYCSALHAAADNGFGNIVRMLLENGADVNIDCGEGCVNPIHSAATYGYDVVVRLLIEHGANVDAPGGTFGSALQRAMVHGHEVVARLLIEGGADPETPIWRLGNALHGAVRTDRLSAVRELIKDGADVNFWYEAWGYPLHTAAKGCDEAIVRLLIVNGADVNACNRNRSVLAEAAEWGDLAIVRLLIEKGATVNAQGSKYDGSILQRAAEHGNDNVVRLLIENGADVNAQGGFYGNALQAAAARRHMTIVCLLIQSGAHVNVNNGYYGSALQAAILQGNDGMVRLLIEQGADVNTQAGKYGNAAVYQGRLAVVSLLLQKGANVHARTDRGTALKVAKDQGYEDIQRILLEYGANSGGKQSKKNSSKRQLADINRSESHQSLPPAKRLRH